MTAHVLEILDALGLARVRLVGQSMAGKIAANVALAAPERVERLVLIGAVGIGRVRARRCSRTSRCARSTSSSR